MKTRFFAAATLAAVFALGTIALADTNQGPAPTAQTQSGKVSQAAPAPCDPAKDAAIPLAIWLTPTGVQPLYPQATYGAAMRGACVGTQQYAPGSQPFLGAYPYPASWYVFGVNASQQYRGI